MTPAQKRKLEQLEDELGVSRGALPIRGESEGYVFVEVDGVTVIIRKRITQRNPRAGYVVPSLPTYPERFSPTNVDAAIRARELFDKQAPIPHDYGHLGPIVSSQTWQCDNAQCRCVEEPYARRVKRSLSNLPVGLSNG